MAPGNATERMRRIALVDVLPQVSQMTCGGGPSRSSNSTKSRSLVITTAPASLAISKILRSFMALRSGSIWTAKLFEVEALLHPYGHPRG